MSNNIYWILADGVLNEDGCSSPCARGSVVSVYAVICYVKGVAWFEEGFLKGNDIRVIDFDEMEKFFFFWVKCYWSSS
ncbi:hypothetical protein TNCT_416521 [Trichonephila clavata]|uniref:Uncharacterized protein n=1 Tax=Trichonephila clavata TaxID=2740835 RepID=A0A8X6FQK2_TRICU|nr:hypothetical protein TNCT_416521 [Trichonephila clavata]